MRSNTVKMHVTIILLLAISLSVAFKAGKENPALFKNEQDNPAALENQRFNKVSKINVKRETGMVASLDMHMRVHGLTLNVILHQLYTCTSQKLKVRAKKCARSYY